MIINIERKELLLAIANHLNMTLASDIKPDEIDSIKMHRRSATTEEVGSISVEIISEDAEKITEKDVTDFGNPMVPIQDRNVSKKSKKDEERYQKVGEEENDDADCVGCKYRRGCKFIPGSSECLESSTHLRGPSNIDTKKNAEKNKKRRLRYNT